MNQKFVFLHISWYSFVKSKFICSCSLLDSAATSLSFSHSLNLSCIRSIRYTLELYGHRTPFVFLQWLKFDPKWSPSFPCNTKMAVLLMPLVAWRHLWILPFQFSSITYLHSIHRKYTDIHFLVNFVYFIVKIKNLHFRNSH